MATIPEALAVAECCFQAGRLQEAEGICRQILQADPGHADTLNLLGVVVYQMGQPESALEHIRLAIRLRPGNASYHNNLGEVCRRQGRLTEAEGHYREAVRLAPGFAEAHYNWGLALQGQGQLIEAMDQYRKALQLQPRNATFYNDLGNVLKDLGQLDEAVVQYRQALQLEPGFAMAHNNVGTALQALGALADAEAHYREALRRQPDLAETPNNLGVVLQEQHQLAAALAQYQEAVRLQPDFTEAHDNLGNVFLDSGQMVEAECHYREALRLRPTFAKAKANLGNLLLRQGLYEEALAEYEGSGVREQRTEDRRQRTEDRAGMRARFVLATMVPFIYDSKGQVQEARQAVADRVGRLEREGVRLDLMAETAPYPFYLAYQGFDDRPVLEALGRMYDVPPEERAERRARGARERIRVGFISAFFRDHTIGNLMRGVIANLGAEKGTGTSKTRSQSPFPPPRVDFEVIVLSLGNHDDEVARSIRQCADEFVVVPTNLAAARRVIAGLQIDVLFYADIGMEAVTYTLGFSRLAPVQCVTWGHPSTTGSRSIDYFISSELFETDEGDASYTESLVRLPSLTTYYHRPVLPGNGYSRHGREHFGLGKGDHVYGCLQSLFKMHPEFDDVLAGILRADPRGVLVLLDDPQPRWRERLLKRFSGCMPDVLDRIRFAPRQKRVDYLNLVSVVDVLLDPFPFGGGNTSLEGLALGVPIVTKPTSLLRGRSTMGMYRRMQLLDCVAGSPQEYIEIAVKLGADTDYRAQVRQEILDKNGVLYEDMEAVRELERFFKRVVSGE